MEHEHIRRDICEVGALLYERGLVVAGDGNLSVRVDENKLLITPSGVCKGRLRPDMIVCCTLDGAIAQGDETGRQPSSEIAMHLCVYRHRPDVHAVVHAHPPVATAFAVCRRAISEAYLPEVVVGLGNVPVCDFALPSTPAVAGNLTPYLTDHQAALLANHGAITWAPDIWKAFDLMEQVEHAATVHAHVHALGGGVELDSGTVAQLKKLRGYYAQRSTVRKPHAPGEKA